MRLMRRRRVVKVRVRRRQEGRHSRGGERSWSGCQSERRETTRRRRCRSTGIQSRGQNWSEDKRLSPPAAPHRLSRRISHVVTNTSACPRLSFASLDLVSVFQSLFSHRMNRPGTFRISMTIAPRRRHPHVRPLPVDALLQSTRSPCPCLLPPFLEANGSS